MELRIYICEQYPLAHCKQSHIHISFTGAQLVKNIVLCIVLTCFRIDELSDKWLLMISFGIFNPDMMHE